MISEHTKVIQAFVETSDSPFGCLALKKLFELADVDQSGSVDREELKAALLKDAESNPHLQQLIQGGASKA